MKFIIIVLMTSCEPNRAFKMPGTAPQIPPAIIAARIANGTSKIDGQPRERQPDPRRRKRAHIKLPFGANIKQATTQRDRYRQSRKNQWRRIKQRVAPIIKRKIPARVEESKRAVQQNAVNLKRIVSNRKNDNAADNESGNDGDERKGEFTEQCFHLIPLLIRLFRLNTLIHFSKNLT